MVLQEINRKFGRKSESVMVYMLRCKLCFFVFLFSLSAHSFCYAQFSDFGYGFGFISQNDNDEPVLSGYNFVEDKFNPKAKNSKIIKIDGTEINTINDYRLTSLIRWCSLKSHVEKTKLQVKLSDGSVSTGQGLPFMEKKPFHENLLNKEIDLEYIVDLVDICLNIKYPKGTKIRKVPSLSIVIHENEEDPVIIVFEQSPNGSYKIGIQFSLRSERSYDSKILEKIKPEKPFEKFIRTNSENKIDKLLLRSTNIKSSIQLKRTIDGIPLAMELYKLEYLQALKTSLELEKNLAICEFYESLSALDADIPEQCKL